MELKKNKTNKTSLDVTCENRHEVLKQKTPNWMWWRLSTRMFTVIQSSCYVGQRSCPYTLTDESQQYGNIEETSVIARAPGLASTSGHAGDRRQTPRGLKNTVECRLFRQKLLQRPLALRCGTRYIQPHELHHVVVQYLDGPVDSLSHKLGANSLTIKLLGWTPVCVPRVLPYYGWP